MPTVLNSHRNTKNQQNHAGKEAELLAGKDARISIEIQASEEKQRGLDEKVLEYFKTQKTKKEAKKKANKPKRKLSQKQVNLINKKKSWWVLRSKSLPQDSSQRWKKLKVIIPFFPWETTESKLD